MSRSRPLGAVILAALLSVSLAGCGANDHISGSTDVAHGKDLFQHGLAGKMQACGSCHTLADAGTTGTVGPDLDAAFAYMHAKSNEQRFDTKGLQDVILAQILEPNASMKKAQRPTGQDARDVAAYVAQAITSGGSTSK
jgi:mono/diheme cytochrome c family protein